MKFSKSVMFDTINYVSFCRYQTKTGGDCFLNNYLWKRSFIVIIATIVLFLAACGSEGGGRFNGNFDGIIPGLQTVQFEIAIACI